jgi:hypothetical protein
LENAGDPETGDPMDQGGEWGFIAFFALPGGRDVSQVQTGIPREERCLLDHLSPFGTSCSLSFSPSIASLFIISKLSNQPRYPSTDEWLKKILHI